MNDRKIALFSVVICALFVSLVAGVTKKGLEEVPPLTFAALRFGVASLCVLPFFLEKRRRDFSHFREITPVSFLATINVVLFVLGIKLATANVGVIIYAATPFLAGLLLFFLFKEKLVFKKTLGIIIGFFGVLTIVLLPLLEANGSGSLLGNMLLSCAVFIWALYTVYSTNLLKKYSPFTVTSNFIFTTTVVLIPFFLWDIQNHYGWWNHVTGWGIFSILYIAIVTTVITYVLSQYAIKHGGAVFAGTTFYITPVLGFVANFFLLGEKLTPGFVFGSILALLGTFLVMRR